MKHIRPIRYCVMNKGQNPCHVHPHGHYGMRSRGSANGFMSSDKISNCIGHSYRKDGPKMEDERKRTREENHQEYLQLKDNPDYLDVTFDEQSGGVSAVHKEHCFDKQLGPFGCRRGQYELDAAKTLRENGYSVLLESEYPKGKGIKAFDALINGDPAEIKTVESDGRWSIRTKIHTAISQGARILVLYYPHKEYYSEPKIHDGWSRNCPKDQQIQLKKILVAVEGMIIEILKPPG